MKHGGLRTILCFIAIVAIASFAVTRGQITIPDTADDRIQPIIPDADRYATGRLFLEQADQLLKPNDNVDYQVLIGNVKFRRGDMYMYCDSAHFNDITNILQAYGNVKMEQGDTLFVYADELEYTDSIELAVLYADQGKKVRLINRDVELRTDIFNYDLGIELGYYEVGGELIDNRNRLTSVYGEYAPNTKDAIFRHNVHLTSLSESDTLTIYTDALHYNTDTHIADLTEQSTIISKDGTIYTSNGVYNTETTIADLYSRSLVVTKTGKTLTGDTLFYDHKAGYGEAWGAMELNDTVNKSKLKGEYGFYNELTDSAFVTGKALAVDYSSADSLSLHGDTIKAFRVITITRVPAPSDPGTDSKVSIPIDTTLVTVPVDTIPTPADTTFSEIDSLTAVIAPADTVPLIDEPIISASTDTVPLIVEHPDTVSVNIPQDIAPADTVPLIEETIISAPTDTVAVEGPHMIELADTTHHVVAYPNVRFYRSDIQGVCDSMTYIQCDSLLYMDIDPIVWSGDRQITGTTIIVHVNDSTADRINIPSAAFMVEMLEPGYYNQLSGRELVAYLVEGTLRHLDVSGNVTTIFYPMESDSTYNKMAQAESSFMSADFDKGQIEKLKMWPQSTQVLTPLYLAKRSMLFLKDFRWDADRRPKGHDDLMPTPAEPAEATKPDDDNAETTEPAEATEPTEPVEATQPSAASQPSETPDTITSEAL